MGIIRYIAGNMALSYQTRLETSTAMVKQTVLSQTAAKHQHNASDGSAGHSFMGNVAILVTTFMSPFV